MGRSPAATLGERANADLQRIFDDPAYQRFFCAPKFGADQKVVASRLCDLRASTSKSGKQTAFAVRLIQWQTSEHPNITSTRARA
jgi:hypothetical protein